MAHNFDISKLTGRLQQLAYDADADRSGRIDTEAEYSIFKDRAYVDCTEGALAKEDFKNILDKCSPEQQKLIYEISELVSKTKFENVNN